jgi:NAD(P)-dependent dehydrogenase (short-subunit alcohol dehydrogenase family)
MFSPFVFTEQLLPLLLQTARTSPKGTVRIINIASNGAKQAPKSGIPLEDPTVGSSCTPFECYGISKIGVILWTRHLAKMHPSILSFAPHPGPVQSNLTRELKIPKPVMWILNVGSILSLSKLDVHANLIQEDSLQTGAAWSFDTAVCRHMSNFIRERKRVIP